MGAPGLAFETWDPPSKGRYNSQNVYVGKSLLNVAQGAAPVRLDHHSVPKGQLNLAQDAVCSSGANRLCKMG
jgi:hypothetical protein